MQIVFANDTFLGISDKERTGRRDWLEGNQKFVRIFDIQKMTTD